MSMTKLAARLKLAGPHDMSLQLQQAIPGTPFVMRGGEVKEERLPGMRRWVDRDMLERAMAAQDAGTPQAEYLADEESRSLLRGSLGGAGLGAISGYTLRDMIPHKGISKSPLQSALLGSLLGAGAGTAAHYINGGERSSDAAEAYRGAARERPASALPQDRQDQSSAAASTPLLLHTGPSVA